MDDLLSEETAAGLVFTDQSGNQQTIDAAVFHSVDRGDGKEQARTAERDDGRTQVAFEDLDVSGHSDRDINDVQILITSTPTEVA